MWGNNEEKYIYKIVQAEYVLKKNKLMLELNLTQDKILSVETQMHYQFSTSTAFGIGMLTIFFVFVQIILAWESISDDKFIALLILFFSFIVCSVFLRYTQKKMMKQLSQELMKLARERRELIDKILK